MINKEMKIFVSFFLITFILMFVFLIFETGLLNAGYNFITNLEYQGNIVKFYQKPYFESLFLLMKDWWMNYERNFDSVMIWTTNCFQLLLPFFGIFVAIIYKKRITQKDQKQIVKFSFKLAISTFLAYVLFYIFVLNFCNMYFSDYITRELFLDILGESFYYEHIYFYYILEGSIRFLLVPFIYSASCIFLSYVVKNEIYCYYYITIAYFFLSTFGSILTYIFGDIFLYLMPNAIMISGGYENISTVMLITSNLLLFLICLKLFKRGEKTCEKI